MTEPVFATDGALFVPTEHARGPWDPQALHGGAPAALIARAIERIQPPAPMRVVRATFEIVAPVPMAPLALSCDVVRDGRRVQILEALLSAGDRVVMRARALRIRTEDVSARRPESTPPALPGPDELPAGDPPPLAGIVGFGATTMELRFAAGSFAQPGPSAAWFRVTRPIVDDEPISPLQRVMAAGDFGNGISSVLEWDRYLFINPDLTIQLVREPVGEWVLLDARSLIEPDGIGLSASVLSDTQGTIGYAAQSLFVGAR